MSHERFNQEALALAVSSRNKGNHPFGAILVHGERTILRAENTVVTSRDVTQHAELRLVSMASKRFDRAFLKETILYSSTEPCAMCTGAIYWAGIRKVVFGLSAKRLGELTSGSFVTECKAIFEYGREAVNVIGPIEINESEKVHDSFWKQNF